MTKKQLVDGARFTVDRPYHGDFVIRKSNTNGRLFIMTDGNYFCNISKITDLYIYCYLTAIGQVIYFKVPISSLTEFIPIT